ncbi:hypothetical protein BMJ34_03630 [Sinorhizobium medicae]|uniref:Uncharacterized protein n=1 Tax=Sinorhizobium medicae TaxID=110321 RepID=A0ABX4TFI5_9HYPH|nr:hypothetical protein BMJ35_03275 [Sinorhizobium medicae]PLT97254.1 hypothetical protein BMJ33_26770 [Sinorhizobium medicae]PLU08109.1 hypothetical protein BMJ34_03630 [Sinorhizobium medicae]PLU22909.1 hypothetical protein BMJ30_03660 [Sinorhizobium medicae]PLU23564.1 hypothetical protein BMJ29_04100 [Sinorhizobium medicae]
MSIKKGEVSPPSLDHVHAFRSGRSKNMNVINSRKIERDAGGKPRTFPHPVLSTPLFRIAELFRS